MAFSKAPLIGGAKATKLVALRVAALVEAARLPGGKALDDARRPAALEARVARGRVTAVIHGHRRVLELRGGALLAALGAD